MLPVDLVDRHDTLGGPLGWAFSQFLPVASVHPALGLKLLTAERPRLHFLAFVLAMTSGDVTAEAIDHALGKPMREVLADMGLSDLHGLRRLLGRIPGSVMEREHYRLIASLLAEPSGALVLHHAMEVSAALLENIRNLPPAMRSPVIVQAIAHIAGAALHVLQWIDIIAARLQRSSQDIQRKLGGCASLGELRTELNKLLDALPALEAAPPKLVQAAARVDTPSAIRQLGKRFHNCLAGFVDVEVDGTTHRGRRSARTIAGLCIRSAEMSVKMPKTARKCRSIIRGYRLRASAAIADLDGQARLRAQLAEAACLAHRIRTEPVFRDVFEAEAQSSRRVRRPNGRASRYLRVLDYIGVDAVPNVPSALQLHATDLRRARPSGLRARRAEPVRQTQAQPAESQAGCLASSRRFSDGRFGRRARTP
jgi:hypothetical protein